jgi:molybdopterin molybdotransferase
MITFEEAKRLLFESLPPRKEELIPLESSIGSVLAEDIFSDIDMPPFNKSAMDGYAIICADTKNLPCELELMEEIPAGKLPQKALISGKTSRVMTGSMLPEGANAVIKKEEVLEIAPGKVRIDREVKMGENICWKGEDAKKAHIVLRKGTPIRAQEIGILCSVGRDIIKTYKKPIVSVLSTGDEIVSYKEFPPPGKIRDSNSFMLYSQILSMGLQCRVLKKVEDDREKLLGRILEGLKEDVLIISGGVSVGEYDYVIETLESAGVKTIFHKVRIKPGKPFYFGKKGEKAVFGLPGNPVSVFVTFEVFVREYLGHIYGKAFPRIQLSARIKDPSIKRSERTQFIPGKLTRIDDVLFVQQVKLHGSADIFALSRCDSLIIIPAGSDPPQEAEEVLLLLLEG